MATDYAQLRTTNPAEYQRLIQQQGQQLAAGLATNVPKPATPNMGIPQQSNVPAPAPTNMGGFNSAIPGLPTAPSSAPPSPPKDMSGFKSTMPNMGVPQAPSSPVPAPAQSNPAPNLTRTGNSVSGQLTPEQMAIFNSLPPEARGNYISGISGMAPSAPQGMPNQSVPAPNNGYGQSYPTMSPDQIKAEVAAKIAAETARRATAASQAKTGIQTSYNRLRTNVGQDRVLQDLTTSRNANPFSGRTPYDKGIANMERERTDREQSEDLQTRLANIDVSLQDYINATPEQQRSLENELIRQERSYAQQVEQFGYQKQRDATSDTRYTDETAYKRGQDQISNDRNAANDKLVIRQQHIAEAAALSERYGIVVEPKDDYQFMLDQVAGLPTVAQQTAAQKQQSEQRSEAWKVLEMLGSVPSYLADILGIPAGTPTQKAKEAAMDAAYKDRTANIAQQNANTSARSADSSATIGQQNANTAAKNAQTAADKANLPKPEKPPTSNEVEAEAVSNLSQMTPGERASFFDGEAASIIKEIGITGYNRLYSRYFDETGKPK